MSVRNVWTIGLVALTLVASACAGDGSTESTTTTITSDTRTLTYDFVNGSDGWASEISDYTDETRPEDVLSQTQVRPPGIDEGEGFFHLSAANRSDDLFHYMFRSIGPADGIEPGRDYRVTFDVVFASNAPSGCAGIGGAPGESVWMKVGASDEQPIPVSDDGETRLSVGKGNQSSGGPDAGVAGVIANGIPCEEALDRDPQPYAMVELRHTLDGAVTAGSDGTVWVFVGVDSGFEGTTSIYYDAVTVRLTPS